jgi:hypothetical protein
MRKAATVDGIVLLKEDHKTVKRRRGHPPIRWR